MGVKKFKGDVKVVPTKSMLAVIDGKNIHVKAEDPDSFMTRKGVIALRVSPSYAELFRKWVEAYRGDKNYPSVELELEIKIKTDKRSLSQNALYWSLLEILAFEIYRQHGWKEVIHEEMLALYAPRVVSKLHNTEVYKRSSAMDTCEMTKLIEGVFYELADHGVSIADLADIETYWVAYNKLRFTNGIDHGYREGETLNEYRNRIRFCEACKVYLNPNQPTYKGHLAHIVSRGASGEDETWNILHLCHHCHIEKQHQEGWAVFIKRYPHIENKVKIARERNEKLSQLDLDIY